MDYKDEIRTDGSPRKGGSIINRNGLIFAFFLLLSFIFWYLNSLSKDLETELKLPVSYINLPKNKEFSGQMPSRLNMLMSGPGYSILRLKISRRNDPLILDFSKVGIKHLNNEKKTDYYIVTTGVVADFNAQIKSTCKITEVKPDTLFFSLRQASE